MRLEYWNNIFQWASVWLLGITFAVGAASMLISRALTRQQNEHLSAIEKQAADANERAGNAIKKAEDERLERVKLEGQIAPRRLTADQQREMATGLAPFARRSVLVKSYALDVESAVLGAQVISVLDAAHISVTDNRMSETTLGNAVMGVNVTGSDERLIQQLITSLQASGIAAGSIRMPSAPMISSPASHGPVAATILIGVKPLR